MNKLTKYPKLLRYGGAVAVIAFALGLHGVVSSWVSDALPPFIFFHPAVAAAALLGGLGPGFFATLLSILAASTFYLAPIGNPAVASLAERVSLLIFTFNCVFLCFIAELYRRSRARANREALRESDERFRTLARHAPVGIYMTDARGNCQFVNERWQAFAGMSFNEALGSGWLKALHPDDRERVAVEWGQFAGGGAEFSSEYRFKTAEGKITWLHGSAVALKDEGGAVKGFLGSVADITARKHAEVALRSSEERFRRLMEQAPVSIQILTPDGRTVRVNRAWEKLWGITLEHLKDYNILQDKQLVSKGVDSYIKRAFAGEAVEIPLVEYDPKETIPGLKDQGPRLISAVAYPIKDQEGQIQQVVLIHLDVTERQHLEEQVHRQLEELENLYNTAPIGLALIDRNSRFLRINDRLAEMNGLPADQHLGRRFQEIIPDLAEQAQKIVDRLIETGAPILNIEVEGETPAQPGIPRVWNESWYPLKNDKGEVVAVSVVVEEITERKRALESLKQSSEELQRSNEDLEQFAAIASHDLKEPLRIIGVYADLLARRYQTKLDSKADDFFKHIIRNTGRMGQLIDSLLIYSHAGKEKGNYQEVDLNAACKHAMKNLELIIKESNAAIHCDDLPRIQADETQMIQLFQNLIGNAVKFRSNQPLIINIRCKPEEENYVISVKDNGIGIAADYFVRIFEVFRKLHSQTEYPGTGVGLAICKRVVENHGGRIWLNSKEGKGTTFYFSLPQRLAVELSRHRHTSSRAES